MIDNIYKEIESIISVDKNIFNKSLNKLSLVTINFLNDKYNNIPIIESIYRFINNCDIKCSYCKSKTPTFISFKRGYKKTCKKCSNFSKSNRKLFYRLVNSVDNNFKRYLKFKHFKWAINICKVYGYNDNMIHSYIDYINGVLVKNINSYTELIQYINKLKEYGSIINKEKMIFMYGQDIGIQKYLENKEKQKGKGTLEFYIKRYGKEVGEEFYYKTNKLKDSSSLEFYIKKYGKELGTEKYKNNCKFQSYNNTLEYYLEKYGQEEGTKKWNEYKYKLKVNNDVSIEYYVTRGYTLEEAKILQSERQKTFSKTKCIERYGELEGLIRWEERQRNWQKTLQSKSYEELKNINIRKLSGFKWFKDYMNFSEEEAINFISNIDKEDFKQYSNKIFKLSDIEYKKHKEILDPYNLRGWNNKDKYELDHKLSRFMGYVLKVPVEIMSSIYNLEILKLSDNKVKGIKCSITKEELYKLYEGRDK